MQLLRVSWCPGRGLAPYEVLSYYCRPRSRGTSYCGKVAFVRCVPWQLMGTREHSWVAGRGVGLKPVSGPRGEDARRRCSEGRRPRTPWCRVGGGAQLKGEEWQVRPEFHRDTLSRGPGA